MPDDTGSISSLSYVVPAYNEEARLGASLKSLIDYASDQPYHVEIIVVDDGSADRTVEVANEAIASAPEGVTARLVPHEVNRGKGAAVRTGALAAESDVVLYLDADLSTLPAETAKVLRAIRDGADVAIGSRIVPGGGDMRASQPALRRISGRLFAMVRRRFLLGNIEDTQCGFKAFRREAAKEIFSRQRLEGWAFDGELLYLAERLGYTIAQVPVDWHHEEGSRMQLGVGSALREIRDLIRIRLMHRGLKPVK
jgi:dolichyl-phosphate beta-glucosyltransferase